MQPDEPTQAVEILQAGLAAWNIDLSDMQRRRFAVFAQLLVEWNANRMNLTRLVSPREIAVSHFLDSLAITQVCSLPRGAALLDIGAGAGFPSLPIKILRPDLNMTLLEATAKKLAFCRALSEACDFADINFIHGRAEETGKGNRIRGIFDVVTARAVAPMRILIPWAVPYLARSGVFVAWKGPAATEEMEAASDIARIHRIKWRAAPVALPLSGEPPRVHQYILCQRED